MKQSKSGHPLAVDSETGLYWHGQRVLRHRTLIEEAMRKSLHGRAQEPYLRVKPGKPLAVESTGSHCIPG